MTITSRDALINALGNYNTRFILDKPSMASQTTGSYVSLWRAAGQPGQGAIPTTAKACDNTLVGGMNFAQQTEPATSYGAYMEVSTSNSAMTVEIHDRIADNGGLVGNVTSAQTVGLDLSALLATSNVAARIGDDDYSDVQWWLEWYTATGSTAVTATVAVTMNDASTTTLAVPWAATRPIGHLISLNSLVPAGSAGKFIRSVDTVTLSATTGTAGNFGVTATRVRMALGSPILNYKSTANWADLGLPEIKNGSCLVPIVLTSTTSSGTVRGGGKIVHG